MKTFNFLVSVLVGLSLNANAQDTETQYIFQPHWELQLGAGAQHTRGEIDFSQLISPNAQLSLGYQFSPVFGTRLSVNAWQSKAGIDLNRYSTIDEQWSWKYVAPSIDAQIDMTNLLGGFKPTRRFSWGVFAGIGANVAFDNEEANSVMNKLTTTGGYSNMTAQHKKENMDYIWSGTNTMLNGRFGTGIDCRISDRISAGVEAQANILSDRYNSKDANNPDWYFNALASIKIKIGKTYSVIEVPTAAALAAAAARAAQKEPEVRIVEKPVEVIKEVVKTEPLKRYIFFEINSAKISSKENVKVQEIVSYMNNNPESKVSIGGYADKNTGNASINERISKKRSESVAEALKKAGIAEDRISIDSFGDTVQPFSDDPELNRVAICIAE